MDAATPRPDLIEAPLRLVGRASNTPAEKTAATAHIRRIAPDEASALTLLAALNLTDPYQPIPGVPDAGPNRVKLTQASSHGTRTGFDWHREHRVPLCRPCRAWGDTHEQGAH